MPTTNPADIHDSAVCNCEMCVWADAQEREMNKAAFGSAKGLLTMTEDFDKVDERGNAVCDDIDAVLESLATPETDAFEGILTTWVETLLELNKTANVGEVLLLTRVGMLGQKLIYKAHAQGLEDARRMRKEVNS